MKYLIETEKISLDYSEERVMKEMPAYRMTLYDKYGHFDEDVYITDEQMSDLLIGLEKIKNEKN